MDRLIEPSAVTGVSSEEAELARLEVELAAAQARLAEARRRLADIDLRPALLVEVEASVQRFDEMEREFEAASARIDEEARLELERVLVESRATAVTEASGHV